MNYDLSKKEDLEKSSKWSSISRLQEYLKGDWTKLSMALLAVLINSIVAVALPYILGEAVDKFIVTGDKENLYKYVGLIAGITLINFITTYLQILWMGKVGQNVLYRLRHAIFEKVQSLPVEFFNVNKSGDVISRINSDTDKLNQAFSETLLRFIGNIFIIVGIGVIMLVLNFKLGALTLVSTIGLFLVTQLTAPWVRSKNKNSLDSLGNLSGEIQESLSNFKVFVAFNKRRYFLSQFEYYNEENRKNATWATIANNILTPIYDLAGNLATVIILVFGIRMIIEGDLTIGSLITFLTYSERFYSPLRIMASLFTSIQSSLAAWARITEVLNLRSNLSVIKSSAAQVKSNENIFMEFDNVSFGYSKESMVLKHLTFKIMEGKTYALIGPTGGGKSTTASLMARLFDPTEGVVYLHGKDIRSFEPEKLSKEIGFILQEPFLFTATLADNLRYSNVELRNTTDNELIKLLKDMGLESVVSKFKDGLKTQVNNNSESISLGQKQLIAFIRAILRKPRILILDEATANIDTVTEALLQQIIDHLPNKTTKIIIAHRLNTIKNADEIYFIANGQMQSTMSFEDALKLVNKTEGKS